MMTVENEWYEFAKQQFHGMVEKVSPVQFNETKKTFFATFAYVLMKMLTDVAALPSDQAQAQLQAYIREVGTFLKSIRADEEKKAAIPKVAETPYERMPQIKADRPRVFDLMDHLRRAFENFCNSEGEPLQYMDAFMGVHNFHKLIIQDIADRQKMPAPVRAMLLKMSADTYSKAMEDLIAKG